jgi:hypothetical protein
MANRTPQTQEKRRRTHEKLLRQQQKTVERNARNAAKREAKEAGVPPSPLPVLDPRVEFFPPTPKPE